MAQQTLEQFGQTIKAKYPQYKDMSDVDLGTKMLAKYPQYKDMVSATPLGGSVSTASDTFGGRVQQDITKRGQEVLGTLGKTGQSDFSTGMQLGGSVLGLATDVAGEIPGIKQVGGAIGKVIGMAPPVVAAKGLAESPIVKPYLDKIKSTLGSSWDSFAQKHPEAVADLQALVEAGKFAATAEGGRMLVESAPEAVESIKKVPSKISGSIKGALAPKTLDEVLATPESEVSKLNTTERKAWMENQQSKITEEAQKTTTQIKSGLEKQKLTSEQKIADLQKQMETASRDKVIELRPKIVKAMGEQSQEYRALVDKEMAGKEGIIIKKDDLSQFVENRFGEDPARAEAIKQRLGLSEQVDPLSTKPTKLKSETTLGDIYKQTKSLKQEISKSKVFTSDDKLTDDAINTLSGYLKDKGIDLKEANQFWSKYAPVRDQLVSEAKPFVQSGTQTKTFANTLMRVAKGTDINNENFINEVENILGEPITKENQAIVSKLNETQKSAVAAEIKAESDLAETKMLKDESLKKLSEKEFEIERQARLRSIIKKVLLTAGGVGLDKLVKKYTGFGL